MMKYLAHDQKLTDCQLRLMRIN